jgi:NADH dehydrogenase [ubiquinone] 1 alpha subcomplex assembly factor 7
MAHEVFDAMPVYLFQQTEQGWRELVVDILEESSVNFQLGISKKKTKPLLLVEEKKGEVGDIIQISPQTNDTAVYIANHINKNGGAGLFIDYGDVEIKRNTLRGIKNHEFVSVFEDPGNVDLSVDVEFGAIKKAIESKSVHVFGPLDQGVFLKRMGIEARVLSLISKNGKEARAELTSQYERLVRGEMGKVYKVQAIADSSKTPYPFDIQ